MACDYLGNELEVGDDVVFMQIGYRGFIKGEIISLSAKKARIRHKKTNVCSRESIQFHNQIIKL